ncbi:hypothetical protein K437DRAFT_254561 [Tilletiaria anomala UBC 951]|uniref:Uncharacterized protein n=1 Tax=Tilletiaria anomala (strain ATCC 24038 / CBS 436.72 / UBC 951) TaxID=1037660 RepID=A0A066WEH8_TILAU|nr:uncharacterized protein K437DRAFT_254561 [Tilletiaria anomala UBC 951]KDN52176.1 hypothetical protein K437DRAFT_254561 [Tilletiaria anomala UBC 951]
MPLCVPCAALLLHGSHSSIPDLHGLPMGQEQDRVLDGQPHTIPFPNGLCAVQRLQFAEPDKRSSGPASRPPPEQSSLLEVGQTLAIKAGPSRADQSCHAEMQLGLAHILSADCRRMSLYPCESVSLLMYSVRSPLAARNGRIREGAQASESNTVSLPLRDSFGRGLGGGVNLALLVSFRQARRC